jgi:hypothetical protein
MVYPSRVIVLGAHLREPGPADGPVAGVEDQEARFPRVVLGAHRDREAGLRPRVWSHCRFRNRGTEYASKYGVKWASGGAKRQCDRALLGLRGQLRKVLDPLQLLRRRRLAHWQEARHRTARRRQAVVNDPDVLVTWPWAVESFRRL